MAGGALGPIGSEDNGDGTFTFQMPDGTSLRAGGPVAAKKHAELSDGAPDMRTAELDPRLTSLTHDQQKYVSDAVASGGNINDAIGNAKSAQSMSDMWHGVKTFFGKASGPGEERRKAELAAAGVRQGTTTLAPPIEGNAAASATGGGPIPTRDLVGAGPASPAGNQIPTVVTGGAPQGGRVVPGHMQLAATQTQETKVPEEAKNAYGQASDLALNANTQETAAEMQAAGQIASLKKQNAADISAYDQRMNEAEARRSQYLQERQSRLDNVATRFAAMKDAHAPSAGIGGALAMGLGAAGAVIGKTQNFAMDVINKQIDNAVDAQKANAQKAKSAYDLEENAYAQAFHLMGDQRTAELSVRNKYLDQAVQQLDTVMADVKSPLAQARGQQLRSQLLQQKADTIAKIGSITEHNSYVMTKPQAVGGVAPQPIHDDVKKNEVVKGDGGKLYEFGEGGTAQKAAEQIAGLNQQETDAHELSRIVSTPSNLVNPEARARATAISARMVEHAKGTEGNGVKLSKEGIDLLERARGGDPNALMNFGKSAGLQEYIQGVKSQRHSLIEQHAVSEVREYRDVDAKTGQATLRYVRQGRGPERGPDLSGSEVGE